MKHYFGIAVVACSMFFSSAFALKCVTPLPTFTDMYTDASVAFRGTVSNVVFTAATGSTSACVESGSAQEKIGSYAFTFTVHEPLKGEVPSTITLTRSVDEVHCVRGGGCADLQQGEEYVVLTEDKQTLAGGLCSACPYLPVNEFVQPEPAESCVCTMQYDPVCGVDGVTYGNACAMACAKVAEAHSGECVTMPEVDLTCTSRYDGCNTCSVTEGKIGGCTKMACFAHNREKCLAHDFVLLKPAHELIIKQTVEKYLAQFSDAERVGATQVLIDKVAAKKADIQMILATSLFLPESPELRRYQLMLEVLAAIDSLL